MAMKVCYNVLNGEVISENRGGVRRDYWSDSLGNTLGLQDSTGAFTDTFDYFPSGTVASRTGTTPTPFQWVGNKGYYRDNSKRTHVRARNFNVNLGRWQEPDPIGFKGGDFNLYRYVKNRFVVRIDPSGLYDRCIPSYASAGFGDNMEKTYTNDSCCEVLPNGNVKVNCGVPFYYIARFQCFGKGDDDPLDTLVKKNRYSIYQQICFGNLTLDGQKCPAANKCMDDTRDPNNTSPCDTISTPVGPYCYQDDCGVGECKGPYKIVIPWVQQNYYSIYMTLDDTPQLKGTFTAGQASKNVYEATFTTYIGKMSKEYCPSIGPNPPLFSAAPKKWKIAINVDYNGKDKPKCTATGSLL